MNNQTSDTNKEPLWQYVPADDYLLPSATIEHVVRTGIVGLWQKLRPSKPKAEPLFKAEDDLQALSEAMLDQIASAPDWRVATTALNAALEAWLDSNQADRQPVVIVGVPHTNNAEILTLWAEEQKWRVIKPPTPEDILAQNESWLDQLTDDDTPWVLPSLERCYLRHAQGLALIRRFFDQVWSDRVSLGVIGCDGWAWAYLRHIWPGTMPLVFVAQAFTHEDLAAWFQALATGSDRAPFLFRQQDNGEYVLEPPPELAEEIDPPVEISNFLKRLASHSRGIPGVAWALWRQSLLGELNKALSEEQKQQVDQIRATTIWVSPWDQLKQPSFPAEISRVQATILHTRLLHNGLPAKLLAQLLSLSATEVFQHLYGLHAAGLVEKSAEMWRVSALGYPVVRRFLQGEGYLTD